MSEFGFDPSIILANMAPQPRTPNLTDLMQASSEAQQRGADTQVKQANLGQMLYNQQRQRTLADLVSQNSDKFASPMGRSLAQAGFGQEAIDAETSELKRQEQAASLTQIMGTLDRSKAAMVKTPEHAEQFISSLGARAPSYGFAGDEKGPEALSAVQNFRSSGITPEQQAQLDATKAYRDAELGIQRSKLGDVGVNPVTGGYFNRHGALPANPQSTSPGTGGPPAGVNPLAGLKPKDINEQFGKLTDSLSDNNTRKLLGQNAQTLQRAEALETLLHVPDLNAITPQQFREAGTSLAGLISKGGPQAVSQIEELVPPSKAVDWANFKQKWLNEPEGANAAAFLQNMLETTAREKKLTISQQQRIRQEVIPNYAYLRNANSARFDSILKAVGLDPSTFDENGLTKSSAPAAAPSAGGAKPGETVLYFNGQPHAVPNDKVDDAKKNWKATVTPGG